MLPDQLFLPVQSSLPCLRSCTDRDQSDFRMLQGENPEDTIRKRRTDGLDFTEVQQDCPEQLHTSQQPSRPRTGYQPVLPMACHPHRNDRFRKSMIVPACVFIKYFLHGSCSVMIQSHPVGNRQQVALTDLPANPRQAGAIRPGSGLRHIPLHPGRCTARPAYR